MQFEKPGCFGFAVTYNVRSQVCQTCSYKEACAEAAKESIAQLSQIVGTDSLVKLMQEEAVKRKAAKREEKAQQAASNKPKLPEAVEALISSLPNHAARTARAMIQVGVNHRKSLLAGVNSMRGQKPATVEVLFDLLIAGPTTRQAFIEALKRAFDYTNGTASSQASIVIAAVQKLGIILEQDGCFVVRGNQ